MIDKSTLKAIIFEQKSNFKLPNKYIKRNLQEELLKDNHTEISVITGLRRVGKSTLLLALKKALGGDYFINFDDERLTTFELSDFQILLEVLLEVFGDQNIFYFDEIQNIKGWERFARRLYDMNKKVFITGSNANLLSADLGTHLTGRYIPYSLFPLSFAEFLSFKYKDFDASDLMALTTTEKVKLVKYFKKYLNTGGIPKYVTNKDLVYLQQLVQDVLYRDVVKRYNVEHVEALDKLTKYSFSNFGRLISARKLAAFMGVRHPTASRYLKYLEQAYVLFTVPKYAYSVKQQFLAPKKLYVIDLALAKYYGFSFTEDFGHKLENTIFLHLKRQRGINIFYFSDRTYECDFVIHKAGKVIQALQVTTALTQENTKREINGLIKAMQAFKLKHGTIITLEQEQELDINGYKIDVVPIYKWLLLGL